MGIPFHFTFVYFFTRCCVEKAREILVIKKKYLSLHHRNIVVSCYPRPSSFKSHTKTGRGFLCLFATNPEIPVLTGDFSFDVHLYHLDHLMPLAAVFAKNNCLCGKHYTLLIYIGMFLLITCNPIKDPACCGIHYLAIVVDVHIRDA